MTYKVKEIFYTLQCEGANTGRAAVFCRFSGCNLWSGHEQHRKDAVCNFCDTDFIRGFQVRSSCELADKIDNEWRIRPSRNKFVVLTGGEPGLQVDDNLIHQLKRRGFRIAIETNGTVDLAAGIDWICVSPKSGADLKVTEGDELKLVFPQDGIDPNGFLDMRFDHFFLQPMDAPYENTFVDQTVEFCKNNPSWRLSLQIHKGIGIR